LGGSKLAALLLIPAAAAAQTAPHEGVPAPTQMLAPGVEASVRLAETLRVPAADGRMQPVEVTLGDWALSGAHTIVVPAQRFFYVATLTSGSADVSVAGDKSARHSGDVWTVSPGKTMSLTLPPRGDRALLRILTLRVPK